MASGKYYTVWEGRHPGVYSNWEDAREQIEGFPGARYKSFSTSEEATIAYRNYVDVEERRTLGRLMEGARKHAVDPDTGMPQLPPGVDPNGWAVDASCLGNPGLMEYRGVHLASGQEIFRVGPFRDGTNNIGEFLAIIHAAALMVQKGWRYPIYTDSKTALSWVRNRRVKTTLTQNEKNAKLFELLERASRWLNSHDIPVPIIKWKTEEWGEIPADFGRK